MGSCSDSFCLGCPFQMANQNVFHVFPACHPTEKITRNYPYLAEKADHILADLCCLCLTHQHSVYCGPYSDPMQHRLYVTGFFAPVMIIYFVAGP